LSEYNLRNIFKKTWNVELFYLLMSLEIRFN
jgi:hypothetical protein